MDFSQIIEIFTKIFEYITSLFGNFDLSSITDLFGSFDLSGLTDLLG